MIGFASFGSRDSLRFIQDTRINSPNGRQLCLMAKTTLTSFVFPLALSGEYVWGLITARDQAKSLIHYRTDTYLPIAKGEIARFQASGDLPSPLPPIKYRVGDVISVWIGWFLVLVVVAGALVGNEPVEGIARIGEK
jgi:hypothetical protein